MIIQDIPDGFKLITDSQEVEAMANIFGWFVEYHSEFDSLFVNQTDGGIDKVYGFIGIVPLLTKTCIELPC